MTEVVVTKTSIAFLGERLILAEKVIEKHLEQEIQSTCQMGWGTGWLATYTGAILWSDPPAKQKQHR